MSFEAMSESRIREAMAEGKFRDLKGRGRPLQIREVENLAGEDWLGNHMMAEADALPEWLLLGKDVERQQSVVAERRDIFDHLIARCAETGEWDRFADGIRHTLGRFVGEASELRRLQDRFNYLAPGPNTQRPGFWLAFHLERMASQARAAGAPEDLFTAFRKAG